MKRLTLLSVSCLSLSVFMGSAKAADLIEVYRDALAYDAQYAAARAAWEAGQEKLPQGRAGLLPTLTASANTTWNEVTYTPRTTPETDYEREYNTNGYQLTLTQPIFRWQNIAQYGQAKQQVILAEAQFKQAQQDLVLRVTQAYFDVLLAEYTLETVTAQKEAIAQQLEQAKVNFEVGTATITDSHEAQSRFDLASAQALAAESDLQVKREVLTQMIGRDPGSLQRLRADVTLQAPQPQDMGQWAKMAEESSPSVMASQAAYEISDHELGKARAGHYPTLDLVATRGRTSATQNFSGTVAGPGSDTLVTTVGLQLNVPLFAGGGTFGRQNEAYALRDKSQAELNGARRSAGLAARQSYLGVTSGLAQVKAYEQALVSSESALESNKLGYEVGVRINIDVLNAQQQLFTTRRDLSKARYDTLFAQLRLKASTGALTEEDLQQINALLEQ